MKKVPCEVFSRIVGYYRPLSNWNLGKKEEFKDRTLFKLEDPPNESVTTVVPEVKV